MLLSIRVLALRTEAALSLQEEVAREGLSLSLVREDWPRPHAGNRIKNAGALATRDPAVAISVAV